MSLRVCLHALAFCFASLNISRINNPKPTGSIVFITPLREDEVRAVFINSDFRFAVVRSLAQPFFHPADILCRGPQAVILRADNQQFALDALHLDRLRFRDGVRLFGILKQLAGTQKVADPFVSA